MCSCWKLSAQELQLPVPSPLGIVSQQIGLTTATVTYSRPSMKGRKIFGGLVPFDEVWRTGANACTKIEFDTPVMINGQNVPAGSYSLFTIPGENEWTIILNKTTTYWGAFGYKQDADLMRFTVKPLPHASTETFTIDFADIKPGSATLGMYWENTLVAFDITVDFMDQSEKNIQAALKQIDNAYSIYNDAAEFYLDNDLDPAQALTWAKQSTDVQKKYWNMNTLSRAYAANGMYKEAVDTATQALELAKKANNTGEADTISKNLEDWSKKL